jgi:hypothetical protein
MVANPGSGTNLTGLAPVVDICRLDGSACSTSTPSLAQFTTDPLTTTPTPRGRSEIVRERRDHYIVNWHTAAFNLVVGATYRVCVSVDGQALGHADVEVVGRARKLRKVNTNEFVGLVDDRTLQIKFRIEDGALGLAPDEGCGGGGGTGTISGRVLVDAGLDATGYRVYLLDQTTGAEVASTKVTDISGAYTFTSNQFDAGTSYVVCQANPLLTAFNIEASTPTPDDDRALCNAPFDPALPFDPASKYAQWGYLVTAPASADPGVGGKDFNDSRGT